jgi:chemotaxis protein MotB
MSNSPADDERLDHDPTDELPILLETAVLDPDEHRVSGEDTGEHTALYAAVSHEAASLDALKHDLELRAAKIESLERDIARLSARWIDVERHLTEKDTVIANLNATIASTGTVATERAQNELRLTAEIKDRDAQLGQLLDELERLRAASGRHAAEIEQQRSERAALAEEFARTQAMLADATAELERRATTVNRSELQVAREELATLTSYIANRRVWWDELEARAADQARRIGELERELANRTDRQQRAEQLAQSESTRAQSLREELVAESRRAEALTSEVERLRTDPAATRATIDKLSIELAAAKQAKSEVETQLAAVAQQLTSARAESAERDARNAVALRNAEAERDAARQASATAAEQAAGAARSSAAEATSELMAQLEAELEHKRTTLETMQLKSAENERLLAAATGDLDTLRRQAGETRAQLDQSRADVARLERALIDKDRTLEARDERIATLQAEIDQKLGALQKLNAMDLSLQGLDSKMMERLRRGEPAVDMPNTPALVCLTSDVPRQYGLTKKTLTIGRSSHCDIQVLTHFVSREHARVTVGARGVVVIEDLGSTNGVFVNAVRVDRQELRHGDIVTIGETQFRFLETMAH